MIITITNNVAVGDGSCLTTNSIQEVEFSLSSDWSGYTLVAIVATDPHDTSTYKEPLAVTDNKTIIPADYLTENYIYIGVFGELFNESGEFVTRKASTFASIYVDVGAYSDDPAEQPPLPESIWTTYLETINQIKDDTEALVEDLNDNLSKKADKVTGATSGNLAGLDANGNLTDSGNKASDFETADTAIMKTDEAQTMTADLTLKGAPTTDNMAANKKYVDEGLQNKVDIVTGKALSTNDLTDVLKANYDSAYINKHTHDNKNILDNTTASFTAAQEIILANTTGANTGDQDLSGKVDRVAGATAGNLAKLEANGNIADSGYSFANIMAKTSKMILPVGISTDGKFWATPESELGVYGVIWNKVTATCTRIYGAKNITTTTTNFGHFGSVNASYSNPFDDIYPWKERKLCNIDLAAYAARTGEEDIESFIKAWEDDVDFSHDDADGVWVYTPEFWCLDIDEKGYRMCCVSDHEISGWLHAPASIAGRWHGTTETRTISGASKSVLLPKQGLPGVSIAMSTLHTYAKNYGGTLDDIYSYGYDTILQIVEYATMNTQNAIGNGVSDLYRQATVHPYIDETASNRVIVAKSGNSAYFIAGAILDIGTTDGAADAAHRYITAVADYSADANYIDVTFSGAAVDITTSQYLSIHGLINKADSEIGSKSGYIGTNGSCNAYYRGAVSHGNMHRYILGAYRQKDTGHIWTANSSAEADNYDALNTSVHTDTGLILPQGAGGVAVTAYIKTLGLVDELILPPFCVESGGDSTNPVGDYVYVPSIDTADTVLFAGGPASYGSIAGRFCGFWYGSASNSTWYTAAVPRLK